MGDPSSTHPQREGTPLPGVVHYTVCKIRPGFGTEELRGVVITPPQGLRFLICKRAAGAPELHCDRVKGQAVTPDWLCLLSQPRPSGDSWDSEWLAGNKTRSGQDGHCHRL